ncbi:DJ-1/PfpI family protein [Pseudobutyrivibrio ruminis]|uniref:4-methyl-5(B-hydroxyethyl)-thiazole monophosphate biosynthesis n=1 Tax=Pseudobutyrivibrio ruminis DSM 9787 TaxID=1123011 RepID=A0A285S3H9_9FIRM|nr:DJ-1/PfpI family protein [Pseudobutyrivibrio ruminis]SOC01563.1 4-methyl-5(b-hydroxyethyl)-thiazole monophosphate biosynthesis [Pseudobutyrivibrio ruminis DSM 9787]
MATDMNILLFCCNGFEMMEFAPFYDVAGWAKSEYNYDVQIDICGFDYKIKSAFGNAEITADKIISEVKVADYDAIAIPGGDYVYGYFSEAYDERFLALIKEFNEYNKIIASVCVGALPVGKSGALVGRNATTYHLLDGYRQKELAEFGATIINKPVVIDNNIITSYCPQTAPTVAFKLMELLIGEEKVNVIKQGMGY